MLQFKIIPVTPFQQNCSVIWCDQTLKGAIIDPGGDLQKVLQVVRENNLTIEKILLTHAHVDHAGATADLAEQLELPIIGPEQEDKFWIDLLPQVSQQYGFPLARSFTPEWLNDGDLVEVGQEKLTAIHCPGHTPGHLVFYSKTRQVAFVGDVLFQGSIGRTDFPRGDYQTLINSIKNKLWPLGNETQFVPGHGPMSSFGQERLTNPFVKD